MKEFVKMIMVNGGIKFRENVEILSHAFHNPNYDIVCIYTMFQGTKTEVTYFKNINTGEDGYEVYFFKGEDSLQHYYSKCYTCDTLPKKYEKHAVFLKLLYSQTNFYKLTRNDIK